MTQLTENQDYLTLQRGTQFWFCCYTNCFRCSFRIGKVRQLQCFGRKDDKQIGQGQMIAMDTHGQLLADATKKVNESSLCYLAARKRKVAVSWLAHYQP